MHLSGDADSYLTSLSSPAHSKDGFPFLLYQENQDTNQVSSPGDFWKATGKGGKRCIDVWREIRRKRETGREGDREREKDDRNRETGRQRGEVECSNFYHCT